MKLIHFVITVLAMHSILIKNQIDPVFVLVLEFDHTIRKANGIIFSMGTRGELQEPETRVIRVNF